MPVFLFNEIIFGPVHSRRFGASLGINLLPLDSKLCNYNCVNCECGWTPAKLDKTSQFHPQSVIKQALAASLTDLANKKRPIDTITFAGNGEPTMHPQFAGIIDDTIQIKNESNYKQTKIAVLSNATMLGKLSVIKALKKVDFNVLKLDSGVESTIRNLNQPTGFFSLNSLVDNLQQMHGQLIIQTLFLRGNYNGKYIDNTTKTEIAAWLGLLQTIKPQQVMLYSIARDTPLNTLEKVGYDELMEIAEQVTQIGIVAKAYD